MTTDPISHAEMIAAVRRAIFDYDLEDLQGARERARGSLSTGEPVDG